MSACEEGRTRGLVDGAVRGCRTRGVPDPWAGRLPLRAVPACAGQGHGRRSSSGWLERSCATQAGRGVDVSRMERGQRGTPGREARPGVERGAARYLGGAAACVSRSERRRARLLSPGCASLPGPACPAARGVGAAGATRPPASSAAIASPRLACVRPPHPPCAGVKSPSTFVKAGNVAFITHVASTRPPLPASPGPGRRLRRPGSRRHGYARLSQIA